MIAAAAGSTPREVREVIVTRRYQRARSLDFIVQA
jgi:hypothetical protein